MADSPLGLRERKKLRTREAIIEAALKLFKEHGFEETTVAEIAEAAEVAPRTFFSYFPTKEDVVFADFPEMLEAVVSRLHNRPPGETAIDAVRAVCGSVAEHAPDEGRHELQHELIRRTEALAARDRIMQGRFQDELAKALKEDLGDELQAQMVAAATVAALSTLEEVESGDDRAALLDQAMDFVRSGLAGLPGDGRPRSGAQASP